MPDIEKVLNAISAVLKLIFGENVPPKVNLWIGYTLAALLILLLIWAVLLILSKVIELIKEKFIPLFYKTEEKRRSDRRRRFAEHVESEIRQLNLREAWHDYQFAELEAEVETEGRHRRKTWIPFVSYSETGLRREKSLSKALETSEERLILLEGDPGSGKSVALRHVAQRMANRAMRSRSTKSVIPIYVNLKTMERRKSEKIDRNLIHNFVLQSLNRANDRDIEDFLDQEFAKGMQEGTWLFLFDSFDELPDVLSSTEADDTIRSYGQAITDFLQGMNKCRGIIASRQFRGPRQLGWPKFSILPLTEKRRKNLIKRAELNSDLELKIVGHLGAAEHEMRVWASNPMVLNLLCAHMRAGNLFPEHTHSILETYLNAQLTRDKDKLKRRFNLEPGEVREAAEKVAFCMTADAGLGLNPTRSEIKAATERLRMPTGKRFDTLLDALEYLKIARSEGSATRSFTFAHRRFQEYFATSVVLREPDRVTPHQLLTDARWRETTVVLFQTQPQETLLHIIAEASSLLSKACSEISGLIHTPTEYLYAILEQGDVEQYHNHSPEPFTAFSGCVFRINNIESGV